MRNINSRDNLIRCDVLVVGAGPAGSGAAIGAAKKGLKTVIIDKKKSIGSPVECGECLDPSLLSKYKIRIDPTIITAKQKGTIFWLNKKIRIENFSPEWISISIDRQRLDKFLAYEAARKGADILVGAELIDVELNDDVIINATIKTDRNEIFIEPKIVIAADGTFSTVGQFQNRKKLTKWDIGRTVSYEMTNVKLKEKNAIQMFLDDIAQDGYGYIIPKSKDSANVGIGRLGIDEHPWEHLDIFLETHPIVSTQVKDAGIIQIKTGETPLTGPSLELQRGNVLYVGDTAGQNLAHVGEGAIPSHICGRIAGQVAARSIGDISLLSEYHQEIEKKIGPLLNECALIRDTIIDIWTSKLHLNKKILLGGLVMSEVVLVKDEKFIKKLLHLEEDDIITEVSSYLKENNRVDFIKIIQ